jgi:UDP-N-acetylmuramyl pentapeptide phosphotransferase/UDP-N-acetylglucosamine-1-phosphate transferase
MWSNIPDSTKWTIAVILALIGAFFVFMTYGAMIASKKDNTHISGVPFVGGFFIFLGFILSPIKWLAFLALLDPGFLMIPYNIWQGRKAKKDKGSEEK